MEDRPSQAESDDLRKRLEQLESRVARIEAARDRDGTRSPVASADQAGTLHFAGAVTTRAGAHYEWQQTLEAESVLDRDWSESAAGLSALAHSVRLLLLHEVLAGRGTVAELSAHERLGTTGQLYHHLRQLVSVGWLQAGARGQYEVPAGRVVPLLIVLAAVRP